MRLRQGDGEFEASLGSGKCLAPSSSQVAHRESPEDTLNSRSYPEEGVTGRSQSPDLTTLGMQRGQRAERQADLSGDIVRGDKKLGVGGWGGGEATWWWWH